MKIFIRQRLLIILSLAMLAPLAHAQMPDTSLIPKDRPAITEKTVQNVLNSFRALKSEFKNHNINNAKEMTNYFEANNAHAKMNSIIQKYGYQNFDAWQGDVVLVAMIYGAYRNKLERPSNADMQLQINKILSNPNLSAEQKESMAKMMESASSMVGDMVNASDAEIAIIKKHAEEITRLFDH